MATNQKVGGSNPSCHAKQEKTPIRVSFLVSRSISHEEPPQIAKGNLQEFAPPLSTAYHRIIAQIWVLNPSCHAKQKRAFVSQDKRPFLNDVFRYAERDAHFVRDVSFGSDVRFAREAEHITSLRQRRNITIYKPLKLCYNIIESEVLLWQNQNYVNYQWTFPLIS